MSTNKIIIIIMIIILIIILTTTYNKCSLYERSKCYSNGYSNIVYGIYKTHYTPHHSIQHGAEEKRNPFKSNVHKSV